MARRGAGSKRKGIPGLSFSPSRALGVAGLKNRVAKATGMPTTRAGRQRKVGAAAGCAVVLLAPIAGLLGLASALLR